MGEKSVVFGLMERTAAQLEHACLVLIMEEQEKPNPNNALIAALCDAVRMSREDPSKESAALRARLSELEKERDAAVELFDAAEQALSGIDFEHRKVLAFAPLVVLCNAVIANRAAIEEYRRERG